MSSNKITLVIDSDTWCCTVTAASVSATRPMPTLSAEPGSAAAAAEGATGCAGSAISSALESTIFTGLLAAASPSTEIVALSAGADSEGSISSGADAGPGACSPSGVAGSPSPGLSCAPVTSASAADWTVSAAGAAVVEAFAPAIGDRRSTHSPTPVSDGSDPESPLPGLDP